MANDYFRFKQFTIQQDRCAMKVGTDGTLLGAWVRPNGRKLLDVGTGTGLIALMLAQRNPDAVIDAVEIDADACSQAKENVKDSPFADRICVIHASFSDYASHTTLKYDLVVSNPPYFVRSLKNPDEQRCIARHTDALPLEELLEKSKELLLPGGRIALILPSVREKELVALACGKELGIVRQTDVVPVSGSVAKRLLVELSVSSSAPAERDTLPIEKARGAYSQAYVALTQNFYLKMP
ncbi:MAG: methyltransferase [Tannerellaceae bacterium]|jgi:tRNA1Val (adenine37-N6)-methyltransferase|nr:methyltransferase [Tannerellaceae bacterium]